MFRTIKLIKFLASIAALASVSLAATTAAQAQNCSIRLHIVKAGFIVGAGQVSGGDAEAAETDSADAQPIGPAVTDQRPTSSAGTYGAAGAGVTFVGGGQVATLQNGNGVVLQLSGGQVGFQVSLGLAGMTLALR
jgi:hypothetical protein